MSDTVVSLLTPPGAGAIATVEVRGPRAWELARQLFRPAGKPVPEAPEVNRFWFGTLGSDEVVLAVTGPLPCGRGSSIASANEPRPQGSGPATTTLEVHCHGGRRVVRWVMEQFLENGCLERAPLSQNGGHDLLQRAPTLRTASILLDQLNGAFAREVQQLLDLLATDPTSAAEPIRQFAQLGDTVGRHLVEPWKVVIAGAPNVGKSSLINALAGYQRSVVSEVAGTTRDVVSVRVAFDGWPVELIDTAGLRDAEGLEAEGIDRARRVLGEADSVVWVMDASSREEVYPDAGTEAAVNLPLSRWILAMNKSDRSVGWSPNYPPGAIHLSATTGENIPRLAEWITYRLVSAPPEPGAAVPFTSQLVGSVTDAHAAFTAGRAGEAAHLLREALATIE